MFEGLCQFFGRGSLAILSIVVVSDVHGRLQVPLKRLAVKRFLIRTFGRSKNRHRRAISTAVALFSADKPDVLSINLTISMKYTVKSQS